MPLSAGTRVGPYDVVSPLGAGGMGEVYRARDPKLGRDVAIKVLPSSFTHDADYLARFEREAQVLAALNHPNIAAIYGLEDTAIVMELVDGPTLADRIALGPLSVDESIPIAKQIADGLEAAHERGIIHRDLKPANIKITPEGAVKVLDFGLAKSTDAVASSSASAANSPTLTIHATTAGVILGTAAYMSPEQAAGKPVDRRADIWSFGVVLWEMLTGRQLFQGETVSHTLADVLRSEIDFDAVPSGHLRDLLRRCLDRNPRTRLRDIGEARIALERSNVRPAKRRTGFSWAIPAAAACLAIAGIFAALWLRAPKAEQQRLRRFTITPPEFTLEPERSTALISPDGRRIVYLAADKLWIREIESEDARPIGGSEGAVGPFWSPDSRFVAFQAQAQIWKASVAGASAMPVADYATPMIGGAWSADGKDLLVNPGLTIRALPADGGNNRVLLDWDERSGFRKVHPLPLQSGKQALLLEVGNPSRLQIADPATKEKRELGVRGTSPVYSATGHILFTRVSRSLGTDIWAVPFSLASLKTTGEPFPLLRGASMPSVSSDGTLVTTDAAIFEAVVRDRAGRRTGSIGLPQAGMNSLAISPDGKQLAVSAVDDGNEDIWIHYPDRGVKARLTTHAERDVRPVWTPDGKSVVWTAERGASYQILRQAIDGSGEPVVLDESSERRVPDSWSRDGRYLFFTGGANTRYCGYLRQREDGKGYEAVRVVEDSRNPRPSPDGSLLAYLFAQSLVPQIFVRPFPTGVTAWQVSVDEGRQHRWGADGKEIFFSSKHTLMSVAIGSADPFSASRPKPLFRLPQYTISGAGLSRFEVLPDGQFVFLEPVPAKTGSAPSIHVVLNWPALLKKDQAR